MKIENVRLGLATNSSSSHSLIFNLSARSEDWEDGEFGWNEFCCNCRASKKMYLAVTLYENLQDLGDEIARAVTEAWIGSKLPKPDKYGQVGYVDHQSLIALPKNIRTKQIDRQFFKELTAYYLDPSVAIVGGNDNESHRKFISGRQAHVIETEASSPVCRKDPKTGHWVLFNPRNGTKIRLHFDKNAPDYVKAYAPELVDMKITDYCPYNCGYCYQGSTKQGEHADRRVLEEVLYKLGQMEVFEVALGGGEPTMYPEFSNLLRNCYRQGIVPNFTTKSRQWLTDRTLVQTIKECGSKIGVSVQNAREVNRVWHVFDEAELGGHVAFQYVMGTTSFDEFKAVVKAIPWGRELILLGFKKVGRGAGYRPEDYGDWLSVIRDSRKSVAIDTALAAQHTDEILDAVDAKLVTFKEGQFSMYIDAVAKKAAPSSYCAEDKYVPFDEKTDWIKLFAQF